LMAHQAKTASGNIILLSDAVLFILVRLFVLAYSYQSYH